MANFIAVTCEYDINGSFGGNNNQQVFEVGELLSTKEIDSLLKAKYEYLINESGEDWTWDEFVDSGLFDWSHFTVERLG